MVPRCFGGGPGGVGGCEGGWWRDAHNFGHIWAAVYVGLPSVFFSKVLTVSFGIHRLNLVGFTNFFLWFITLILF